jgi:hypothetical protein
MTLQRYMADIAEKELVHTTVRCHYYQLRQHILWRVLRAFPN